MLDAINVAQRAGAEAARGGRGSGKRPTAREEKRGERVVAEAANPQGEKKRAT